MAKTIDKTQVIKLAGSVAKIILANNPKADYDWETAKSEYNFCVQDCVQHYGLNKEYLNDIMLAREYFEKSIRKQYKAKITTGIGSLDYNHQDALVQAGVPQVIRVASGFLDCLIGNLGMINRTIVVK